MCDDNFKKLKWEVRQRLIAIEATLVWRGRVVRKDLMSYFGIKAIQAANDFSKYHDFFPGNIVYDRYQKAYIAGDSFKAHLLKGTSEEFLHLLKSAPRIESSPTVVLLGHLPPAEILLPIERQIETATLQNINRAICEHLTIAVEYQSMSNVAAEQLILSPHSLVHNGFRWHIRAYSDTHSQFRDFLIARIKSVPEILGPSEYGSDSDELWNQLIEVRIAPHPGLSYSQRIAIESDYGMEHGEIKKIIRAAVAGYFLQLMRIGLDDETRPAYEQQIILANKDQLAPYIF